jgi:hypothetical protein
MIHGDRELAQCEQNLHDVETMFAVLKYVVHLD